MMFQKKIDRAMEWLKEKNNPKQNNEEGYPENSLDLDSKDELQTQENSNIELEKGDIPAIIISALLVFGPIILILLLIVFWAYKV